MTAAEIFDICHGRYRGLRGLSANTRGSVHALKLDAPSLGYQWRPERTRASEFVADFERIGRLALRRPEWKGRLKLFEIYFLRSVEYRRAITLVGVAEGTFDYWSREVKAAVGRECARTGLFPPFKYFQVHHRGLVSPSNPSARKKAPMSREEGTRVECAKIPEGRIVGQVTTAAPTADLAP